MILDFHTHNPLATDALISVSPDDFHPVEGRCYSVGLHPWDLPRHTLADVDRVAALATHPQVLAIGETGLDSVRHDCPLDVQESFLAAHVAVADSVGKPLVLHNVRATQQLLRIKRNSGSKVPWVIHGFRSNVRVAQSLLNAGCWLSFGARFNAEALAVVPDNRLLVETDDSDTDINTVMQAIALARNTSVDTLKATLIYNNWIFLGS